MEDMLINKLLIGNECKSIVNLFIMLNHLKFSGAFKEEIY